MGVSPKVRLVHSTVFDFAVVKKQLWVIFALTDDECRALSAFKVLDFEMNLKVNDNLSHAERALERKKRVSSSSSSSIVFCDTSDRPAMYSSTFSHGHDIFCTIIANHGQQLILSLSSIQ